VRSQRVRGSGSFEVKKVGVRSDQRLFRRELTEVFEKVRAFTAWKVGGFTSPQT
jgi:hypothetical protein